jgi:hypothetical protein
MGLFPFTHLLVLTYIQKVSMGNQTDVSFYAIHCSHGPLNAKNLEDKLAIFFFLVVLELNSMCHVC